MIRLGTREVLLGCLGLIVLFECAQFVWLYRARSPVSLGSHKFRPIVSPDEDDLARLRDLNILCLKNGDAILSSRPMQKPLNRDAEMKDLLEEILHCPPAEVFLPGGIRSHGYCEDGMAYTHFLQTRAMPIWVYEIEYRIDGELSLDGEAPCKVSVGKKYSYHDLCPYTAIIMMNHYWDGIDERHDFPPNKKIILMPNVEMGDLQARHYHRVDYVLAKTKDAYHRIMHWYEENKSPRNAQVYYTMHTSSDPTYNITGAPKNWHNLTVFHASGNSPQKKTGAILRCWHSRPDFPKIRIYTMLSEFNDTYWELKASAPMDNVEFHFSESVPSHEFGKMLAEASVILCPSRTEGFGHYINQARASGGLVITTDGAPMNELIDETSGTLMSATVTGDTVLMGTGVTFFVNPSDVCDAVDRVVALTPEERAARGREGRRRYLEQQKFFKNAMKKLRPFIQAEARAN
ncbi:unnamed protein product [Aphanomyces euteiches]|nr:hypothetical protein AeRB84_004160 [Aphanomyces euteiches]